MQCLPSIYYPSTQSDVTSKDNQLHTDQVLTVPFMMRTLLWIRTTTMCVGGSLGKQVDIGVCGSEFTTVVVVPGGVGTRVHGTKCADHELEDSQCCNQLH